MRRRGQQLRRREAGGAGVGRCESGPADKRLVREEIANHTTEHLAGRHSVFAGGCFQFQSLPSGEQQRQFDNFLILAGEIRRSHFKHWMHNVTCPGNEGRPSTPTRPAARGIGPFILERSLRGEILRIRRVAASGGRQRKN